jgi:hypothetical protein
MKRRVTILISALALSFVPLTSASATIKPGTVCKKLNETVTVSSVRYKCIKSGKKLLWTKSPVVVSKATENNQIEQEKLSFKDEMVFRVIDGIVERQAQNGVFYKGDSRKSKDFNFVRATAFQLIVAHKPATSHPKISIEYQISPSFPKKLVDYSRKQIEESANYWNFAIDTPTAFVVKLITEKDRESVLKDPIMYSDMGQALDRLAAWNPERDRIFFTGGGGYIPNQENGSFQGLLMLATSSQAYPERMNFEWPATAAHELTHIIQGYFFKSILPSLTPDQYEATSPNNFREGTANLFGYALSLKNLGWYSDALDKNLLNCLNSSKNWIKVKSESDVIDLLNGTEIRTPEEAHTMSYPTGALLYEWIFYKYGYEKVLEIFKGQGNSNFYGDNINKSLGITKSELYKEAAPYLLANINRVLNG